MPKIFTKEQSVKIGLMLGEILLRCGAETYRAEDTIRRICTAHGYTDVQPFVTPTMILIGDASLQSRAGILRITSRSTNLEVVADINDFSYNYAKNEMSFEETVEYLDGLKSKVGYSEKVQIIVTGIGSAMFTLMLGGGIPDFIASIFVAGAAMYFAMMIDRGISSIFVFNLSAGALVGGLACISVFVYPACEVDKIIVGSIMPFVPGLAFTNGVRDFLSGDLISGNSRISEAFISACSTAFGVGMVLKIWMLLGRW